MINCKPTSVVMCVVGYLSVCVRVCVSVCRYVYYYVVGTHFANINKVRDNLYVQITMYQEQNKIASKIQTINDTAISQ